MNDPVLEARVRALSDDLDFVSEKLQSSVWRMEQPTRDEMYVDSLWNGLDITLIKEIDRQKRVLESIHDALIQPAGGSDDLKELWNRYMRCYRKSQEVLRECLEIIGTLAMRNKNLDERIWYVADELIRECLVLSTADEYYYLLVHTMEDTYTKTTSRILRLRFPEWTIWDLPLAAHELGHVIFYETLGNERNEEEEDRILEPFVERFRDAVAARDPELTRRLEAGEIEEREARRSADKRVHEFMADAFATYTMGPAYACSAILLRLNPAMESSGEKPADVQRAQVILATLSWMHESSLNRPYGETLNKLKKFWSDTLAQVNAAGALTPDYEACLEELAVSFGQDIAPKILRRAAMYPPSGDREGWLLAQGWATEWLTQQRNRTGLTEPNYTSGRLRDVLNATWFCRLFMQRGDAVDNYRDLKELQKVGHALCTQIMTARQRSSFPQEIRSPGAGGR